MGSFINAVSSTKITKNISSNKEGVKSMKSIIDYENLLVEPSSAITLAGLCEYQGIFPENSKICFIITGGLVAPAMIDSIMNSEGVI